MKLKNTLFILLLLISIYTKAQNYVTIPDAQFAAWLNTYYPSCMNGNQMDTTCSTIKSAGAIYIMSQNITDLTGIKYFTSCKLLVCPNNHLTSLPTLPDSLQRLDCNDNQITSIASFPNLLIYITCYNNLLTSLPTLPHSLKSLECYHNQLTSIPLLPDSLQFLYCYNNPITSIVSFPNSLTFLECHNNQLTSFPALPNSLKVIFCSNNQLTSLPVLPNSLTDLYCEKNLLTSLPALPDSLSILWCRNNQLTSLPVLPDSLQYLRCDSNQLNSLPSLPHNLKNISCSHNNISCFPTFPNTIMYNYDFYFDISGNPYTCLPNYIYAMNGYHGETLTYYMNISLCMQGDTLHNSNGCSGADGITGFTYKDINANCLKDSEDLNLINIPLIIYDSNNNFLAQMQSFTNGFYNFVQTPGTYSVKIDTAGMPFKAQCLNPGVDSTITTTNSNPLATDVDFNITCKPGFDIGVQSVIASGFVFPGQQHMLKVVAGEMFQWYHLNCVSGVSGQVIVTVTGPVTYINPAPGALTPSVSGNVFTYTISDFGNIVNSQDFRLLFQTDTTAQAGDSICVNVSVTPISGDNNGSNNNYQFCYSVLNSHDPNMKEVYPVNVLPGYDGYFTYTIHFQNTGTAAAHNIFLIDTLSNNLDLETFKIINYSHNNTASLIGNVLTFRFPDIMLPDSSNNEPGSKGYVQYKIKPKANLSEGTQIKNTAYIYFDNNAPIATNTTVNQFMLNAAIKENAATFQISIYPNPVVDNATLIFTSSKAQRLQIKGYDMLGQEILILNQNVNSGTNSIQINTSTLVKGVYMLSVRDGSGEVRTVKFVK